MKTKKQNIQDIDTEELEKRIITKISKNIIDKKSELEIINSEIFIIQQNIKEQKEKEYLEETNKQIKKMLKKIEKLKEQINIYKNDKTINDAIYLDNKNVIDDILEYKSRIESKISIKEEYELIEEYGIIVNEIDKVNDRCMELEKQNNTQIGLLDASNDEYEKIENDTIKEEGTIYLINDLVSEQINIMKEYEENVGKIEEQKEILYNYDMLKELISLELKYVALMSLSPLKGTLPFIAVTAKQTKDTIDLILAGPLVTQEEKINYIAKDYTKELDNSEYKLNDIDEMLNTSLYSITDLKQKINNNEYLVNNSKYIELISKLEKLEDYLNENCSKIEIYKTKLNKTKTRNKDTQVKILKLNKKD